MIKNLFYNLHVLIQKFMREHIAVVDLSNNITRIYLYEFDDNSHDFIGMEEATIDFSSKENAIAGLFKLVDKLEKQYDLIITKVIVNVPYHYIKIRNFKSKINYNKSYNKKDLAKIFHKKKIEKKLDKSEQFLFLLFKKLQFDNYDFKNILPKMFIKDISYNLDVVNVERYYYDSIRSIFNYLSIDVIDFVPVNMVLNNILDTNKSTKTFFVMFDYNNIAISIFQNNVLLDVKYHNFGINNLLANVAKKLNLPEGVFHNLQIKKLNHSNLLHKFMLLNYKNVEYNINNMELKYCLDNVFDDFLLQVLEDYVDKKCLYLVGELEDLSIFSDKIKNFVSNHSLLNFLTNDKKNIKLNMANIKAISMVKYYLHKKEGGFI